MTRIFQIVSFLATSYCLLFCNTITATQSDKPQDFRIEFFQEARPQNVKVFYQGKEIQHFKASGGINGTILILFLPTQAEGFMPGQDSKMGHY